MCFVSVLTHFFSPSTGWYFGAEGSNLWKPGVQFLEENESGLNQLHGGLKFLPDGSSWPLETDTESELIKKYGARVIQSVDVADGEKAIQKAMRTVNCHITKDGLGVDESGASGVRSRVHFICSKHLSKNKPGSFNNGQKKNNNKTDRQLYHDALHKNNMEDCDAILSTMSSNGQNIVARLGKTHIMPAYAPHALGTTTVSSPAESMQRWQQHHGIRGGDPYNAMLRTAIGLDTLFKKRVADIDEHVKSNQLLTPRGLERLQATQKVRTACPCYNVSESAADTSGGK